ncbi:MAG: PTS glucitol/sorbitol transporter subunit IIA [Anaerostipes sp.]|nr:PTS glucitol/sorbitol transporter subunit IIA [Anaerostipes sp.]
MSKTIFQTKVNELGDQVEAFFDEGMFVLFGENVPDTLKDFCHFIDVNPIVGEIVPGDSLDIDGSIYKITAVGNIAQSNLETLGHLTVVFSGASEAGLPGSICVEAKPMPRLSEGSQISILKEE